MCAAAEAIRGGCLAGFEKSWICGGKGVDDWVKLADAGRHGLLPPCFQQSAGRAKMVQR